MLDQVISLLTPANRRHAAGGRRGIRHHAHRADAGAVARPPEHAHAGHGDRARQDAGGASCRSCQEGRPGPAEDRAQGLHAGDRRQAQPAQRVRDRGGARQAEDGRPARPGAARRLHVLPRRDAGDHRHDRSPLPVRDRRLRLSGAGQDRPRRRAPATSASTCPTCSSRTWCSAGRPRSRTPSPMRSTCC